MQLHINGNHNTQTYSKAIQAWLESNHGHPRRRRHETTDPKGLTPSSSAQR